MPCKKGGSSSASIIVFPSREACFLLDVSTMVPNFTFVEEKIKKDPDQRNYIVSNEKIEKTGFKPRYSLSDGICELIKGYAMLKNQSFGNF